ncbi:peptide-methionine (S)-S-oxide reductase [Algibacter miyuki]|uniref:peptide-methionine (S)-S-oxide reductase n=1 Tax=Algibacter miyuki TaxID=1306933 RepID=A0ABV5GXD4_9FLAO|nr:peptide-methionine (S)-S-oxide reductase [Algibacter miyuki]MDN3665983.1 peptide-methionine (S)-S-oxide reductase [Algibacter miyuki]
MDRKTKIALGGGCHWCTEAVFQSLKGVNKVEQGYVASHGINSNFSEAVIVHFQPEKISLKTLIEVHLLTHKSTSNHSMRIKYRSAIYTFSEVQQKEALSLLDEFKSKSDSNIITQVYPFSAFEPSRNEIQNYYRQNPEKPFCKQFINPKLQLLLQHFSNYVNEDNIKHTDQK